MSKVVCLKLMTGEELIGQDMGDNQYKDMAAIMMVPGSQNDGQVGLGLMPFLPYSDDESFVINENAIIIKHTPSIDMINNYNRIYGSGIQVVSGL